MNNTNSFLLVSILSCILLACNSPKKKTTSSIAGEYKKGTSSTTITEDSVKIGVSICFADESCIEPCFTGTIKSAGNKRYSGWVYTEGEDSITQKKLVVISFYKDELDVLFPQKAKGLGMNCEPGGVYKK